MNLRFFENLPLAISIILAILMVVPDAPPWVIAFSVAILGFKFISEKYQIRPLSRKITGTLSFLLLVEVLVQYRSLFVQEASTTLLIGLTALKVMDYKEERDLRFLFLLGFILVSLKPLYNIDFYWMAPTFVCFMGLWASLLKTYSPDVISSQTRFLAKIFVRAIPLTLVLFVVFPRVVVPWAQAKAQASGQMGFSDELNPGQITELVSTKSLVFRARFQDNLEMTSRTLYWRGAVLNKSLGLEWKSGKHLPKQAPKNIRNSEIKYEILLEPSMSNYLFTLDKALELTANIGTIYSTQDGIHKSISMSQGKAYSYEGSSSPLGKHIDPPSTDHLEVPGLSEKTAKWIEKVRAQFTTPQQRLAELQRFFSDGSFSYSLKPGSYQKDDLDEFLFKKRKGFCEHFAGSYATLARALGIPSRVVTGFQGGLFNSFGHFWRVTTHDAHAWVEVYLNNQWERVDPTDWVAPLRLEIGAEAFFEIPEEERLKWSPGQYQQAKDSDFSRWTGYINNQIEFMNYRWTQFLLDFDKSSQSSLMTELKARWGWALLGFLLLMAIVAVIVRWLEPKAPDTQALSQLYVELFKWSETHDLAHPIDEPPLVFSQRLGEKLPGLKIYLDRLDQKYVAVLYRGEKASLAEITDLKNLWRLVRKNS